MLKHLSVLWALCGTTLAQAHGGHGLAGSAHWHAGDAGLFLGLALVAGLASVAGLALVAGLAVTWLGRRP